MSREIVLSCFDIVVKVNPDSSGSITSSLHDDDEIIFCDYNHAIGGLESLILAHACAGVDIKSAAYIEGIKAAVDAITNNLG